jgi:hypothetical protein
MELPLTGEVGRWQGDSSWHFVTLPLEAADEIRDQAAGAPRGFGSVRVRATIGATIWSTSVFPDKHSGSFILPLKKDVRESEGIDEGDRIRGFIEPLVS